jgi:hypothetical protein
MASAIDPKEISGFFDNLEASSIVSLKGQQITAPMVSGAAITPEEMMMGGGVRVVMHVLDRSPSMEDVGRILLNEFNEEYVAAITEAREDDIATLRIGGISFSSDITPIWEQNGEYFHKLEDLPPLTKKEYDPSKGWGTALHAAILDGYARALGQAQQVKRDTGIMPEIDIVILSDNANNESPLDSTEVYKVVTGSNRGLVRFSMFYFETDLGLDDPKAYAVNDLGFDGENVQIFEKKSNETPEERKSRFRRMMRVMSRVSASKNTSAVKAAAAVSTDDIV